MKKNKAWKGRFKKQTSPLMEKFNASISFDQKLYKEDITASIAYANSLERAHIINQKEKDLIVKGLNEIKKELDDGKFIISPSDEDIHMAVERRLIEKIGATGKKLHTGRSRNDQVVTDVRLFIKKNNQDIISDLINLQKCIIKISEKEIKTIVPGYTHLQQAQPVLLSHYFMSLFWALERDKERLKSCEKRVDTLPLGSGALAGTSFEIDRKYLAKLLRFSSISENSIDAVSDRDFLIEFISICGIIMIHLSRYAEDLIIWSSEEFKFVEIDEAFATGSSMMPQKINPDSLELIRGKTGRVLGNLITIMTVLKGLPLTYNKDLQEDKEPLFDTIDTVSDCLKIFTGVIDTIKINHKIIDNKLSEYIIATDLSDYLVKKGMPFRESHKVVGRIIRHSIEKNVPLSKLPIEKYRQFSNLFKEDVYEVINIRKSIEVRKIEGGTSTSSVKKQILKAKRILRNFYRYRS